MVNMSKQESLKAAFANISFPLDDAEVLSSCTTLLSLYSLTPEALASKWECRYAINAKLTSINMDAIAKWKPTLNKLQEQFQKKKDVEGKRKFTSGNIGLLDDFDVKSFGVSDEVPKENKKKRFTVALPTDDEEDTKIDNTSIFKSRAQQSTTTSQNGNGAATNGNNNVVHDEEKENNKENRNGNVPHSQDEEKKRFIPVIDDDVWSSSQDDADAAFAQRVNPGKVETNFQPTVKVEDEADYEMWEDVEKSVNILVEPHHSMTSYRALSDEMERRSAVLDERLVNIGTRIQEEHMLPRPEMFHIPAQDPVVAMGRVCPDVEGVFGEKSAMLEADDEHTKARVSLDLKYVSSITGPSTTAEKGYSLFPGMVVVVEGVNTNGKSLSVTDIYEPKPLPLYKSPSYTAQGQFPYAPLSILVASGPFTTSENGSYRPLDLLLEMVEKTNPQVVVLIGPFIDTTQNIVKNSDETFLEQFKGKIGSTLTRVTGQLTSVSLPPSKIILVPSLKDPSDSLSLPLYPQPPFTAKEMGLESKWLKCVSNPCTMRVNDVTIGVSSVDILKHLSGSEFSRNVQGDRMSRLCGHLLKQQSYYPLFPPAPEVSIEGTRLGALDLPYAPDILIVPSDLQYFVRNVNDTLCINPGRLTKGKTGGTFAKITVYPQARKNSEEKEKEKETEEKKETEESRKVVHRTKVEIVRI